MVATTLFSKIQAGAPQFWNGRVWVSLGGALSPGQVAGLVCEGDSLLAGLHTSGTVASVFSALTGVQGISRASSGDTLDNMAATYSSDLAGYFTTATNALCLEGGTNDIQSAGKSVAQCKSNIQSLASQARTTGYGPIGVCTIPPRGDTGWSTGMESMRNIYNAWLRANYSAFADVLVDIAAISQLSDPTNTTYYYSDKVHWTDATNTVVATAVATAFGVALASPLAWNPDDKSSNVTLSNSNRTMTCASGPSSVRATKLFGGQKSYVEFIVGATVSTEPQLGFGLAGAAWDVTTYYPSQSDPAFMYWLNANGLFKNAAFTEVNAGSNYLNAVADGDVYALAWDDATGKVWRGKNNIWDGSPAAGTGNWLSYAPGLELFPVGVAGGSQGTLTLPPAATYSPPSGFTTVNL